MHLYSYDGCDSDSPSGSDPLSGSDSEASASAQCQRSLIIILDDDYDEMEEPVHPLPSHRPKRPLPRNFSKSYRSPVKEETVQGIEAASPDHEVYHTINCAPSLRDKSLEELRVECYQQSQIATKEPPKPVSSGMRSIPPSFFPWCDTGDKSVSPFGQVELSVQDVSMDD